MKIVVDTNIIFSALLTPKGGISDLLLNSDNHYEFYTPTYVLNELNRHEQKILSISGYSPDELNFLKRSIFKKIDLIDIESIHPQTLKRAIQLTEGIDEFDAPFIALALELDTYLWTGDKKLISGLKEKNIDLVLRTFEVRENS